MTPDDLDICGFDLSLFNSQCVDLLVKSLKDSIKNGKWDAARYALRFIADLVNCHVISAGSRLQLMDSFVDAALEEGVPQVMKSSLKYLTTT